MDGIRAIASATLILVGFAAHSAEPRLTDARLRSMLEPTDALATPGSRAIFESHFADSCIAVDALPFDRTCNHVPLEEREDPSPWPDVFVALRGSRIVAVLVTHPARVPRAWECTPLPAHDRNVLCTPPDVTGWTRRRWAARWSRVLRSAG